MTNRSRFTIAPIGSLHAGWALKVDGIIRRSSPSLISLGAYVDAIMAVPTRPTPTTSLGRSRRALGRPTRSGWRSSRRPAPGGRRATRSLLTLPRDLAELTFSELCGSRRATATRAGSVTVYAGPNRRRLVLFIDIVAAISDEGPGMAIGDHVGS
jgi:hypothetical protein